MSADPIAWDVVFYVLAGATVATGLLLAWTLLESRPEPEPEPHDCEKAGCDDPLPAWASTDGTLRPREKP